VSELNFQPSHKYGSVVRGLLLCERDAMEAPRPITAHDGSVVERSTKAVRRKVQLKLFELEPESGEDEAVSLDLDLDQIED